MLKQTPCFIVLYISIINDLLLSELGPKSFVSCDHVHTRTMKGIDR
jgi:hypothetical protein